MSDACIALLGRPDEPTDGVEDYCTWLGPALAKRGFALDLVRMPWAEMGWLPAFRWLWKGSVRWQGRWVLVQYAALSWSRRGFPLRFLGVLAVLKRRQCRLAVVFHDSAGFPGTRWIDRLRRACQHWIMRRAYELAERTVHNIPVDRVGWLPLNADKAAYIPVGANLLATAASVGSAHGPGQREEQTVAVFGVTGAAHREREVSDITYAVRRAAAVVARLRLVVLGRGSTEAEEPLRRAMNGVNMELSVLGLLPASEIGRVLADSDVLLFVRGPFSSQRTSGIAGIACGLPVVGYAGPHIAPPVTEAGVMLVPYGDREALAAALARVLSDDQLRSVLRQRSLDAYHRHFSWEAIADRFSEVLGSGGPSPLRGSTKG